MAHRSRGQQTEEEKSARTEWYKEWYSPELNNLSESTRQLLETYSRIPPDQVVSHVHSIREKAWSVWPYPCIGQWRFLQLAIGQHALYRSEILPRMLTGEQIYLDLGCAFAQDIRRLVADGVDSRQCYGSDLRLEFLDLGYELFGDKQTLKSRFIDADIFDTNSDLRDLQGRIDIVDASSFFHLFSLEQQKTIARRVSTLLRPQKDSLVVGRQVGSEEPGEYPRRDGQGSRYRHDLASWRQLWAEVGAELGVRYEVNGILKAVEGITDRPHTGEFGRKMMEFSVRRLG